MGNPSWNPACGLSETKTALFMSCVWFTSMTSCWRAVILRLGNMSLTALKISMNWDSGSHECSNSAAHEAHKPLPNTGTWTGFEISFTEAAKEIVLVSLPSHRRRHRKSKITPREMSQLRALNGQLLRLGMQCLPQLPAPLSLLMGQNTTSRGGYDL